MRKFFSKRKAAQGDDGEPPAPRPPPAAAAPAAAPPGQDTVPPLPLERLQAPLGGSAGRRAPLTPGTPMTPGGPGGYPASAVGRTQSGVSAGGSGTGRSLGRTVSGVSSGRRSARRPRELIELPPEPEQVDAGSEASWSGGSGAQEEEGGAGAGGARPGVQAAPAGDAWQQQQEQQDADLAMAYQLAFQQEAAGGQPALGAQQQPQAAAAPPWQQQQQQWQHPGGSHSLPPQAAAASFPLHGSMSLQPPRRSVSNRAERSVARGEDWALAAAMAESQFAAQQQSRAAEMASAADAEYQAAIAAALEESMVSVNYDDLLRDIQAWIRDLSGATGDVNSALEEARGARADIEAQMAAADPEQAEGWHRMLWYSQQYPLVEERLREVAGRVAPVNDSVQALSDLTGYIRSDQPPLSDAESVRDAVIAKLFEDLGRQGLGAQGHPLGGPAYAAEPDGGGAAKPPPKTSKLRSLLSLGKKSGVAATPRGGDLRDMVRHLIDEARRMPPPPPLPVNYEPLLADLAAWLEALEGVRDDVQGALQDARAECEDAEAALGGADPAQREAWHRLAWLAQERPAVEARLFGVQGRLAPTDAAAQTLRDLRAFIGDAKPTLVEAEAVRDDAIAALSAGLRQQGVPGLPDALQPAPVRAAAQQMIAEAQRLPELPGYVDYSALLASIAAWQESLQGADADVSAAQQEASQATADNRGLVQAADAAADPEGAYRLGWLSEQLPAVEQRLAAVDGQAAPARAAANALLGLRRQVLEVYSQSLAQPPLAEVEAQRDAALADMLAGLEQGGLAVPAGASAGPADVRGAVAQAVQAARQLPEMPPMPVDYSGLLASIARWVEELQGAGADVAAARQAAGAAAADAAKQLAGADQGADPQAWHRLAWLSQEQPAVEQRLGEVAAKTAPAGTAVEVLQSLVQRIEREQPPLVEATAARDAALATLLAGLGAAGLAAPVAAGPGGVRGAVAQAVKDAQQLPAMPPYVDYSALLASLQQWLEALQGAQADVSAAQREVAQATADTGAQLAATAADDKEGLWRLRWLSEQQPLVEARVGEVAGQVAPAAVQAAAALGELHQQIQAIHVPALVKPPLAELEAQRDAAVEQLASGLGWVGLPPVPTCGEVQSAVAQALEEARRLPPMPLMPVDYSGLLADLARWVEALQGAGADAEAAQQEASQATADAAKQLAGADQGADPQAWHRLAWLSEQRPLVEARLADASAKLAPAAGGAEALLALLRRIEDEKPPLEEATAARNAAVSRVTEELSEQGVVAEAPADVRTATARLIEEARRLPEMPPYVDYSALLASLAAWLEALEASSADVSAARAEATQAREAAEVEAASAAKDGSEAWHRLLWLSQERPAVEARLERAAGQLTPTATASAALEALREQIETQHALSLVKPPLAEVEAQRDAALASLAVELDVESGLKLPAMPTTADVRGAVAQAIAEAQQLPAMPPYVDYSALLASLQQWLEALQGADADVLAAQQEASRERAATEAQLAAADKGADEAWHRLLWLSEQQPLVEQRLGEVAAKAAPTRAATAALEALREQVEGTHALSLAKPPLAEVEAQRDAATAELAVALGVNGLDGLPDMPSSGDVQTAVQAAIEAAKRLPEMPPYVDYSALLASLQQWLEALEGAQADVSAAQQELAEASAGAREQLAAADASDKEGVHRLAWLAEQYPSVEARVGGVAGQVQPPVGAATAQLRSLQADVQDVYSQTLAKPALADVEERRDAALASLAAAFSFAELPAAPAPRDVRGEVRRLLEAARRLPDMPGYVDYDPLLRDIAAWVEELRGAAADLADARQGACQATADNAAALVAASGKAERQARHRLSWLAEQLPAVEARLADLEEQVAPPSSTAVNQLSALAEMVQAAKPPLEEAEAARDAAVAALAADLALLDLPPAPRGSDVRGEVQRLIAAAQAVPPPPPYTSYDALLAELAQWIEALHGCGADVEAAQQEVGAKRQEVGAQLAGTSAEEDREGHHRLKFLCDQYPLVEARLGDVARKAAPTAEAAAALEVLRDACDSDDPPPLGEAQAARDATVRQLVASLGRQGMHVLSTGAAVREGVHQLIKRARRIPPVPSLPLVYVAPPAPKATPRLPLVPPKFNPPNLSVPRPRKKSRGVKPSPEDAIRRDPRVITLFNELSRGTGVVAATVAWEAVRAELAAGGAPPGSARRGGTPTPGATPRSASATPRSGGLTPRRSTVSPAAAAAVRSPTTPSPRAASAAAAAEPEPEMSEEQAAAYAVTLPDRTAAVLAFQPSSLQDVSDFVSDVKAQGGDAPRSGHAAAGFPSARWRVMAEAAAVFDALLDACDRLTKWECPPGANVVAEAHRLASYLEEAGRAVARVAYAHDPLRVRMAKAGLPWDEALLTDLRWAAQRAAAALMAHTLEQAEKTINAKRFHNAAVLQPLGSASIGAFKVHQFCGGFNQEAGRLYDQLHEQTLHYARMLDPKWFRASKLVK